MADLEKRLSTLESKENQISGEWVTPGLGRKLSGQSACHENLSSVLRKSYVCAHVCNPSTGGGGDRCIPRSKQANLSYSESSRVDPASKQDEQHLRNDAWLPPQGTHARMHAHNLETHLGRLTRLMKISRNL